MVLIYILSTRRCKATHANTCSGPAAMGNKSIVKTPTVFFCELLIYVCFSQSIGRRGGRKGQAIIAQNTQTHTHRKQLLRMMSMRALFRPGPRGIIDLSTAIMFSFAIM